MQVNLANLFHYNLVRTINCAFPPPSLARTDCVRPFRINEGLFAPAILTIHDLCLPDTGFTFVMSDGLLSLWCHCVVSLQMFGYCMSQKKAMCRTHSVSRYFFPKMDVFVRVVCFVEDEPPILSVYSFPRRSAFFRERDFTSPSAPFVSLYSFPRRSVLVWVMPTVSPVGPLCSRRSSPNSPVLSFDSLMNCPRLL